MLKQGRIKITSFGIRLVFVFLLVMSFASGNYAYAQTETGMQRNQVIYVRNQEQMTSCVYQGLLDQQDIIMAYYGPDFKGLTENDVKETVRQAVQTDCPDTIHDSASIWGSMKSYRIVMEPCRYYTRIAVYVEYRHTPEQMRQLYKAVDNIVSYLDEKEDFLSQSSFRKVLLVHDFLCQKFDYDFTYTNGDDYDGLYQKIQDRHVMVCQGYSLLAYKILNSAGVETKIVTSNTHSWNLVKLNQAWYHMDVTNDDLGDGEVSYDYFLRAKLPGRTYKYHEETIFYDVSDLDIASMDYPMNRIHTPLINAIKRHTNNAVNAYFYLDSYDVYFRLALAGLLLNILIWRIIKRRYELNRMRKSALYKAYNSL